MRRSVRPQRRATAPGPSRSTSGATRRASTSAGTRGPDDPRERRLSLGFESWHSQSLRSRRPLDPELTIVRPLVLTATFLHPPLAGEDETTRPRPVVFAEIAEARPAQLRRRLYATTTTTLRHRRLPSLKPGSEAQEPHLRASGARGQPAARRSVCR